MNLKSRCSLIHFLLLIYVFDILYTIASRDHPKLIQVTPLALPKPVIYILFSFKKRIDIFSERTQKKIFWHMSYIQICTYIEMYMTKLLNYGERHSKMKFYSDQFLKALSHPKNNSSLYINQSLAQFGSFAKCISVKETLSSIILESSI